jgi:multidrug transporter EmrE-like cation transporter
MIVSIILLLTAILFNSAANSCFKFYTTLKSSQLTGVIILVIGLIMGIINTVCYTISLKKIAINVAYPIFSGGCILIITILSVVLFKEKFTIVKILGVFVIFTGIFILAQAR